MKTINRYLDAIDQTLQKVCATQLSNMEKAAQLLAQATVAGQNLFVFGCNHAGLLALELYYRTGGMVNMNPVRGSGLHLEVTPATLSSEMERLNDYGRLLIQHTPIKKGDVIIIHSVSGRNTVTVDAALAARELGATVIALTNMETTKAVASRHPSGLHLYEAADLTIDNCGCVG
ncbi:MAG: sugar isomerase domain-containing protein, partial [Clostridia bacterium]